MQRIADGVYDFNNKNGMLINTVPTIPDKSYAIDFWYNFMLEELKEYKEAFENNDIVGISDSFVDLEYVLHGGILAFGLKDKFLELFDEVQASNMSKSCKTEQEAIDTCAAINAKDGWDCYYEPKGNDFIVKRISDGKVMKSINYFKPNLKKFF